MHLFNEGTVVSTKILQTQRCLTHTTVQFIVRVVLTVLALAVMFVLFFFVYLQLLTHFQRGTCTVISDLIIINNNGLCQSIVSVTIKFPQNLFTLNLYIWEM